MTEHRDRYTHGHAEAVVRAHSDRTVANSLAYGAHLLKPGMTVLDLGCGIGTITADIAEIVHPGTVIAVDISESVLDQAKQFAATRNISNIDFRIMDAYDLDIPDDTVDFAHAHQVLQHVSDPVAVLKEMNRVTRPGGIIAARDGDYASFTWYPLSPGLDEWSRLYHLAARANGGEPDAGRRLFAWAHAAGLDNVTASSSTRTYPAGEDSRWWGGNWADRMLHSAIRDQLLDSGLATQAEIEAIAQAWTDWSEHPDAWLMVPGGEILAVV